MKWNNERGYLTFKASMNGLKSLLGIPELRLVDRSELAPYYTSIVSYLNERLILLGDEVTQLDKLNEIFNLFDLGTEKIILNATLDLAWELGIETTDYYCEGTDIPYNQEHLVFSWSSLMTELCTILRLYYSQLLYANDNDCGCTCACTPGLTTEDLESWSSGVYPEDGCYSNTKSNSLYWRANADTKECTKCYRK